jgi:hypothetical protein
MLYAYCVVDELVDVTDWPTGIAGGAIKPIESHGLIALASEFVGETVAIKRENVMLHEAVVGILVKSSTPLPFRFGTLVTRQNLISFLESRQRVLKLKLEEVRNCVEMSVKVIWSPRTHSSAEQREDDSRKGPGAVFLRAKRLEILGDEALVADANQLSSWLESAITPFVRAKQATIRPSQKLVLSASHLVEREQLVSYQAALKAAVDERRDLHFLLSGPWAPYSFVNIDLEFKTHFGVS